MRIYDKHRERVQDALALIAIGMWLGYLLAEGVAR